MFTFLSLHLLSQWSPGKGIIADIACVYKWSIFVDSVLHEKEEIKVWQLTFLPSSSIRLFFEMQPTRPAIRTFKDKFKAVFCLKKPLQLLKILSQIYFDFEYDEKRGNFDLF